MESESSIKLKDYEILINSHYILDARRKIEADSEIYIGRTIDSKEEVIFKLRKNSVYDSDYLYKEFKIYKELEGIKRIPKLYDYCIQGNYHILIIESLGESLKQLLEYVGGQFTLATTLKICTQILEIIKEIHNRGIVLRYLKPANIVIGKKSNKDYIYLIDFEIAKKYIRNGNHKPYKEGKSPLGNRHFISLNTQSGKEISRRDDIECLGYIFIYFIRGKLPWTHLRSSYIIREKKKEISLDELCEGLPVEFKEFIKYAKNLEFEQKPDYSYLNGLLFKIADKNGIDIAKVKYDWEIKKEEEENNKEEENDKEKEEEKEIEFKIKDEKEEEKEERNNKKENKLKNDNESKKESEPNNVSEPKNDNESDNDNKPKNDSEPTNF